MRHVPLVLFGVILGAILFYLVPTGFLWNEAPLTVPVYAPPNPPLPLLPLPLLPPIPPMPPIPADPVLVLGSSGVVGRALVTALKQRKWPVIELKGRTDKDLRRRETMRDFFMQGNYSYVLVLAHDTSADPGIRRAHNEMIYGHVSEFLRTRLIPYLHIIHTGQEDDWPMPGERTVRLGHIIGPSPFANRSLVSDWIHQCIRHGSFHPSSDHLATKQFHIMHAEDAAHVILSMMQGQGAPMSSPPLPAPLQLGHVATLVKELFNGACVCDIKPLALPTNSSGRMGLLRRRLPALRIYYGRLIKQYATVCRESPYLSVILTMRDDEYGGGTGIWKRSLNSLTQFAYWAKAYYLPYEIVLGEYNKRPTDGSLEARIRSSPFPRDTLVRIRTVPHSVHVERWPDEPNRLWEYIGKNVAARAARGQFLLFTNPDDIYDSRLIGLLARQSLNPAAVYRVKREDAGNTDYARVREPALHTESALLNINDEGAKPNSVYTDGSGDFTLVHRDTVMAIGGYPEIPWNRHVDSLGLNRFLCGTEGDQWYPRRYQVTLEYPIYHQDHQRYGITATPWEEIFADWPCTRLQAGPSWGYGNDSRVTEILIDRFP